jgi:predicted ATPase
MTGAARSAARLERLRIRNYRVLRDVEFSAVTPLTVLVGPNGSGKSTVLDALAFLHEAVTAGLEPAWRNRGGMRELRSRDSAGPIEIEIVYRDDRSGDRPVRYRVAIDEADGSPEVVSELLEWSYCDAQPTHVLRFERGRGAAVAMDDEEWRAAHQEAVSISNLALSVFGQIERYGSVRRTLDFIKDWHVSSRCLSQTGDNLPNVIQYLREREPDRLRSLIDRLASQVPQLASVGTEVLADGRLLLRWCDAPFREPMLSRCISAGAMKLLACLVLLTDPGIPALVGIEGPENLLHPRLLRGLADELRRAADRSQLVVTSHSPHLVDALRPEELWVLYRRADGCAGARRVSDMPQVIAHVQSGGLLGNLWMEGYFDVGDPLVRGGAPRDGEPVGSAESVRELLFLSGSRPAAGERERSR